jgi:hypothetical protein
MSQTRSDSCSQGLDATLRTLGEVVECVLTDRSHFTGLETCDCTHEAEHAHRHADKQNRHPEERTPEEAWRPATPEGQEEVPEADGYEQEPAPSGNWTSDPQDQSNFPMLRVDFLFFEHFATLLVEALART